MAKITYTDKVTTNPIPAVADVNKVTAADMNEIKTIVNGLDDEASANTAKLAGIETNATADQSAAEVPVALTPTNYTAGSTNVEAHLVGINTALAGAGGGPADTDALAEGSTNLYYTEARVNANTNVAANVAKLAGIEANATADQTGAEIKALYEAETNTNVYTDAEQSKLAGLESSKFLGAYTTLVALQTAHPSPVAGSYGDVDAGAGNDVTRYIWDVDDTQYVVQGSGTTLTAAQIKTQYESNANTNAFTDTLLAKLNSLENRYVGLYADLPTLTTAHPSPVAGAIAAVGAATAWDFAKWNGSAWYIDDVSLWFSNETALNTAIGSPVQGQVAFVGTEFELFVCKVAGTWVRQSGPLVNQTGTVIALDRLDGTEYGTDGTPLTNTAYTLGTTVNGGQASILSSTATEPTITGASKITGSQAFVASPAVMMINIKQTFNKVYYYFIQV